MVRASGSHVIIKDQDAISLKLHSQSYRFHDLELENQKNRDLYISSFHLIIKTRKIEKLFLQANCKVDHMERKSCPPCRYDRCLR